MEDGGWRKARSWVRFAPARWAGTLWRGLARGRVRGDAKQACSQVARKGGGKWLRFAGARWSCGAVWVFVARLEGRGGGGFVLHISLDGASWRALAGFGAGDDGGMSRGGRRDAETQRRKETEGNGMKLDCCSCAY
jgi:hypothetical protein